MSPIPLILASGSPRRRELLHEAGYEFTCQAPGESAECGVCSRETPPELVARLALQKARNVATSHERGLILGCDTVAECLGQVLGKPADRDHAREMLRLLRGRLHHVYSGLALWQRPADRVRVRVARTVLQMAPLRDAEIEEYLETGLWEGKAGAFGFQDRHAWLQIVDGSESNVVGLPLELLAEMLDNEPIFPDKS